MRQYLLFSLFILMPMTVVADSYRHVELKHRNAVSLQSRLLPLLGDEVVVVPEGNGLLLRGPSADLNQLVAVIKKLDKPRQQLSVYIYRGVDPELDSSPHRNKTWSTNRDVVNRLDKAIVEEETTLVITDSELISIPQRIYQESYQRKYTDGQSFKQLVDGRHHARAQSHEIIAQENSIVLTPSLLDDGNVSFIINYSIPTSSEQLSSQQTSSQKTGSQKVISTTLSSIKEVTTTRVVRIDEWINLSSHHQQTYRPSLDSKKKVVSTQSKSNKKNSVWIKFRSIK